MNYQHRIKDYGVGFLPNKLLSMTRRYSEPYVQAIGFTPRSAGQKLCFSATLFILLFQALRGTSRLAQSFKDWWCLGFGQRGVRPPRLLSLIPLICIISKLLPAIHPTPKCCFFERIYGVGLLAEEAKRKKLIHFLIFAADMNKIG